MCGLFFFVFILSAASMRLPLGSIVNQNCPFTLTPPDTPAAALMTASPIPPRSPPAVPVAKSAAPPIAPVARPAAPDHQELQLMLHFVENGSRYFLNVTRDPVSSLEYFLHQDRTGDINGCARKRLGS